MASGPSDTRVLVVTTGGDAAGEESDVASSLSAHLPGQTVVRSSSTAAEYLRELGPTVDCVVAVGADADVVWTISETDPSIPLVVYGEEVLYTHVDAVIPSTASIDDLVARVQTEVSESRETNHLEEVNAKLTALSRYAKQITGCETVHDVCDRTVEATHDALDFDFCVLAFVEGDQIVPCCSTLPMDAERPIDLGEGVAGRTLETGEPQVVADMQSDPDATFKEREFRSVVSVPVGDRGVLQVVADEADAYDEQDVEFLEILAGYTNEALARLERETALRDERDRFHAFFEALPVPVAYVEAERSGEASVREINAAYERTFPQAADALGEDAADAFPTTGERRLVSDRLRDADPADQQIERSVREAGVEPFTVVLVPLERIGLSASGYLVYVPGTVPSDETRTGYSS
ncbi:GAF domain-containing protein [Halopelagius longus]|uniref:GAF domain-containing protein n=1 Tax=Halopelagius longus TaxID=1236180 RepID=A0A1H1D3Y0_9EURY|nr:GAF domain-containing protein [Halopelagius longus]RDI71145.1 GAF domain-containing protein [Halopelagius longus]SDQ70868.1 GAF domain-containing protein [Halopelagius longus]